MGSLFHQPGASWVCTRLQDRELASEAVGWGCLSSPCPEGWGLTAERRRWEGRGQQGAPLMRRAKAGQSSASIALAKPFARLLLQFGEQGVAGK